MDEDPLPKVTPWMMTRADALCARRLASELAGQRGDDRGEFARWRVRTPLVLAATIAHRSRRRPEPHDFPVPPDLVHEEERLWERAAEGYLGRFGAVAGRAIDHRCDTPTVSKRHGVRVGGAVDVVVEIDDEVELRQFELWGGEVCADPYESWEIALAVLRLAKQLSGRRLRICHVDLLADRADVAAFDYETDVGALAAHFADRLARVRAHAATGAVRPGVDCGSCRFVAGCPAHKVA